MNTAQVTSKQQAFSLFKKYHPDFLKSCEDMAIELAKKNGGSVSIDDIRDHIEKPKFLSYKIWGSVFSNDKLWESAGEVRSRRKSSHGRKVNLWLWKGYKEYSRRNYQPPLSMRFQF